MAASESDHPLTSVFAVGFRDISNSTLGSRKRKASDDAPAGKPQKYLRANDTPVGESCSAVNARNNLTLAKAGTFQINHRKELDWKKRIHKIDPKAQFIDGNVVNVVCNHCHKTVRVKTTYDASRFRSHFHSPACPFEKQKWLQDVVLKDGWSSQISIASRKPLQGPPKEAACPGLSARENPQVELYLQHTGFCGGGARHVKFIAKERFKKRYRKLTKDQKLEILEGQINEHRWRNDHYCSRVYSTRCLHVITYYSDLANAHPCGNCSDLLLLSAFKHALKKEGAGDKNLPFVNHKYRIPPILAEKYAKVTGLAELLKAKDTSPFVRYSLSVSDSQG